VPSEATPSSGQVSRSRNPQRWAFSSARRTVRHGQLAEGTGSECLTSYYCRMANTSTPPEQLLREHVAGSSYRNLAARHGSNRETVRHTVMAEEKRYLGGVAYCLYEQWRDLEALKEVTPIFYFVPFQPNQQDMQLALSFFQWTIDKLRALQIPLRVETVRKPDGIAFQVLLDPIIDVEPTKD
jgi:hypothetical protein